MELETEVLQIIADYEAAIASNDDVVIANLMAFPFEVIVDGPKKHYYQNQAQMLSRIETFRKIRNELGIVTISREVTNVHQTHSDEALAFTLDTARNAKSSPPGAPVSMSNAPRRALSLSKRTHPIKTEP